MKKIVNRRQFIGAGAMLTAGLALPKELLAAKKNLSWFSPSHRDGNMTW